MFLKLLEKLGRKNCLDRGPSHPDYKNANLGWKDTIYYLGKVQNGFLLIF